MMKPAAGYRPLAYSSPNAVQTTGTVALYPFVVTTYAGPVADRGGGNSMALSRGNVADASGISL
jgi:hypothetical protein